MEDSLTLFTKLRQFLNAEEEKIQDLRKNPATQAIHTLNQLYDHIHKLKKDVKNARETRNTKIEELQTFNTQCKNHINTLLIKHENEILNKDLECLTLYREVEKLKQIIKTNNKLE